MLHLFLGMSRKVIQVSLNNVSDIMKCVVHSPLKCCTIILEFEWELTLCKCFPKIDEGSFVLVVRFDNDQIISQEAIHEGERFTIGAIDDYLVNEQSGIVVFWTRSVQILVFDTYRNGTLFFSYKN